MNIERRNEPGSLSGFWRILQNDVKSFRSQLATARRKAADHNQLQKRVGDLFLQDVLPSKAGRLNDAIELYNLQSGGVPIEKVSSAMKTSAADHFRYIESRRMLETPKPSKKPPPSCRDVYGPNTRISGHASVFFDAKNAGTQFELSPGVYERIGRSAFDNAIKHKSDVRALFNHTIDFILARMAVDTLALRVDGTGLRYSFTIPGAADVDRNLAMHIRRGDVTGSSFSFAALDTDWDAEGSKTIRTVNDVALIEVSPCVWPAYTATSCTVVFE